MPTAVVQNKYDSQIRPTVGTLVKGDNDDELQALVGDAFLGLAGLDIEAINCMEMGMSVVASDNPRSSSKTHEVHLNSRDEIKNWAIETADDIGPNGRYTFYFSTLGKFDNPSLPIDIVAPIIIEENILSDLESYLNSDRMRCKWKFYNPDAHGVTREIGDVSVYSISGVFAIKPKEEE